MRILTSYGALATANPVPDDLVRNLVHVEDFLGVEDEQILLRHLERMPFYHDTFRGREMRRGWAQFGFRYSSTGRRLEPCAPFPDFLEELKEKVQPVRLAEMPVNQCIITRYEPGAGIGWHSDAPAS